MALLGGCAAVTAIALVNAARLGVPKRGRALILGAGLLGSLLDVAMVWGLGMTLGTSTAPSTLLALVVHIVQLDAQRPYDREILLLSRGEGHAPMWLAGAVAVLVCGSVEHLMLATIEG